MEKTVFVDNLKINLKVVGQGEPVLILHGWDSSIKSWLKVQQLLAEKGFKVIVLDLPGFGKSMIPLRPWSVEDYSNFVLKLVQKLELSNFFLFGHSFGGRIAIKFAAKYPDKLTGLILCGAPIGRSDVKSSSLILKMAKFAKKFSFLPGFQSFRKIFYKYILKKTDYFELKGVMKETFKKIVSEDLSSFLTEIRIETLLLWGEKDEIEVVKILNSELIIFPRIGHNPHLEIPEKLVETIEDFLKATK